MGLSKTHATQNKQLLDKLVVWVYGLTLLGYKIEFYVIYLDIYF